MTKCSAACPNSGQKRYNGKWWCLPHWYAQRSMAPDFVVLGNLVSTAPRRHGKTTMIAVGDGDSGSSSGSAIAAGAAAGAVIGAILSS